MTITYPLPLAAFWETLRFASRPEFVLDHRQKQSEDGGGNRRTASFGPPKWRVDVSVAGGRHNDNLAIEAAIKHLVARSGTFLAYDIRRPFPASDPDGTVLGAGTALLKSKGANNRSLSIEGLPAAFKITQGDKLSIAYGSGKVFLAEAMEDSSADGLGDTGEFEIQPFLPAGIAVGNVVSLVKPCGKFQIVAGSYRPASGQGNISSGISFSMVSVP